MLTRLLRQERGNSVVEFALVATLLLLLMGGAVDFARVFMQAISVKAGSAAGALYGSQRVGRSGDVAGMMYVTQEASSDADSNVNVAVQQYCACPDGTTVACSALLTTTCANSYGTPRAYVMVRATETFSPLMKDVPGIPETTTIDQATWIRVR